MSRITPATEKNHRVFGLDIVRAVAIGLVLLAHLLQHAAFSQSIVNIQRLGILGVEIFFVLSGFLIGGILIRLIAKNRLNSWQQLGDFWKRRWLRTLPLYYLYLAIYLRFDWTGPTSLREHWEFLFFLQGFAWAKPMWYMLSWSLSIEEYFYLLFPLALFLIHRSLKDPKKSLAAGISLFLLGPLLLRAVTNLHHGAYVGYDAFNYGIRLMTIKRLDSVMYGVAGAYLQFYFPGIWQSMRKMTKVSSVFFAVVCLYVYVNQPGTLEGPLSGFLQVVYFPILSLSVLLLLPYFNSLQDQGPSLSARIVTRISLVSYSLYLGHILVITYVWDSVKALGITNTPLVTTVQSLVMLTLSYALASLTYQYWETPFLKLRDWRKRA